MQREVSAAKAASDSAIGQVLHVMEATIGGTRRHLRDVVLAQRARGLAVAVVAAAERMPEVRRDFEQMRAAGAEVEELPMQRAIRPWADWRHVRALKQTLKRLRPAVVHTHSSKAGVLGRLASLESGIGVRVHTPHTFAFLFGAMFSPRKRALFRAIEQQLGKYTQRLIAVSESEAETIRLSGVISPEKVRTVPNGIDPKPYRQATALKRAALGFAPDQPLLITVGLLNPAKGQDLAIEALADPRLAKLQLALVGHGEDQPRLAARIAELGLGARIQLLGWREDVPALLKSADGLLLPSRWEGMPYAVLEAMAAGLPVVATAVDGARELVVPGETGWLAPVGDPVALIAALAAFQECTPAARQRLGAAGEQRLGRFYTLERLAEGLSGVYAEALALNP
jgi:glycosyltransferase involved in cell wall biosynthesis